MKECDCEKWNKEYMFFPNKGIWTLHQFVTYIGNIEMLEIDKCPWCGGSLQEDK